MKYLIALAQFSIFVSLLTTTFLFGCGQPAGPAAKEVVTGVPVDSLPIRVEIVDRVGYDEVIAKHHGKVILVDFWATWCVPCVEDFSRSVAFSQSIDPDQFAMISVSIDQPDDKVAVLALLEEVEARFDNLLSLYGNGKAAAMAFDMDGVLPYYKVYDRDGKVVHRGNEIEEVEEVNAKLLNDSNEPTVLRSVRRNLTFHIFPFRPEYSGAVFAFHG